jgi:hypothetical protein
MHPGLARFEATFEASTNQKGMQMDSTHRRRMTSVATLAVLASLVAFATVSLAEGANSAPAAHAAKKKKCKKKHHKKCKKHGTNGTNGTGTNGTTPPPVATAGPTTMTVTCPPDAQQDLPMTFSGVLSPDNGGTTIHISYFDNGGPERTDIVTGPGGAWSFTWTPHVSTSIVTNAEFNGDSTRGPSSRGCLAFTHP